MRNLAIVVALLIVTACVSTMAYFYGSWVPNNPLRQYPVKGIDVSHHNGTIDWRAVADDGVKFAYIKATEGKDFQDDRFITNCREATAAGIVCGAYHYFRLGTPGLEQAQNFIRLDDRAEEDWAKARRAEVEAELVSRLTSLSAWLGDKDYLEGRFTAGDLLMACVLRELVDSGMLARFPNLDAYRARCEARPAFGVALEAQLRVFRENAPA